LRCRNKFDFFGQNIVALTTTDAVNFGWLNGDERYLTLVSKKLKEHSVVLNYVF
jgi:hypothetical protein